MFNITSRKGRTRYQNMLLREMVRLERYSQKTWLKDLNRQYTRVAARVASGNMAFESIIDGDFNASVKKVIKQYRRTWLYFGTKVFREFRKQFKGVADDFWKAFDVWSKETALQKVTGIFSVTKEKIRLIIDQGVRDGKSPGEIAKDIRAKKKNLNPYRARRIAVTEVHSAMSASLDTATKKTGVKFEREWVATRDDRTRGQHLTADKQRRKHGEPFKVGGEELMHPGDPAGSPWNIIFCRCVLLYHAVR